MQKLLIIGSGGHAKVVIEAAQLAGMSEVVGCLDDDPNRIGEKTAGVLVLGDVSPPTIMRSGATAAVIAVGSNRARQMISKRLLGLIEWATIVHPSACISPSARLGAGTMVMAGVIVQSDADIGEHVILNTSSSVDHDCVVGNWSHICPGAHLAGDVRIESGTLVGTGASVIPSVTIGAWSIVGSGGAVVEDVLPESIVGGVPARPLK